MKCLGHSGLFMKGNQDYGQKHQEHQNSSFKKVNMLHNQRFPSTDPLESTGLVTIKIELAALYFIFFLIFLIFF